MVTKKKEGKKKEKEKKKKRKKSGDTASHANIKIKIATDASINVIFIRFNSVVFKSFFFFLSTTVNFVSVYRYNRNNIGTFRI